MGLFTKDATVQADQLVAAAREGYERGDRVHLCAIGGPSKLAGLTAKDVSLILSEIAAAGWEPVDCSFVWAPQVGAVGHYLFARAV